MSAETRGRTKNKLYYTFINEFLAYFWKSFDITDGSFVSQTDLDALKIIAASDNIAGISGKVSIYRANAPTPDRYTKKREIPTPTTINSRTTFGGYNITLAEVIANGWTKIAHGNFAPVGTTLRNTWVAVDLGNDRGFYSWSENSVDAELFIAGNVGIKKVADLTEDEQKKVFYGASLPVPIRLKKLGATQNFPNGKILPVQTSLAKELLSSGGWARASLGKTFAGETILPS